MQNTVYECKQNGEDFFSLPAVTCSRFGNCPANVLVTEQPQSSVVICIFFTWQNIEISLIPNGLRFIFTCPLFLAQPITFHVARHTYATVCLSQGVSLKNVSKMLGHASVKMTEHYARVLDNSILREMNEIRDAMNFSNLGQQAKEEV